MIGKKIAIIVRYGYRGADFVVLDNFEDAAKAMYAKIEKIPVTLKGKFISGQEIKTIEPDVHSYTGWNRGYEAKNGDDFAQIERDVPKELAELLQLTGSKVNKAIQEQDMALLNSEALSMPSLTREIAAGEVKRVGDGQSDVSPRNDA